MKNANSWRFAGGLGLLGAGTVAACAQLKAANAELEEMLGEVESNEASAAIGYVLIPVGAALLGLSLVLAQLCSRSRRA